MRRRRVDAGNEDWHHSWQLYSHIVYNFLFVFQKIFHYNSGFWSNRNAYNLSGGKTGFDAQETKLPTYWNTPFSKICLGMKIGQQIKFLVIKKQVNSLFTLIADGKYRGTSLGHNTWKTLIGSQASLQTGCNKEGFNSIGGKKNPIQKQELVLLETTKRIVQVVTPQSGLVLEGIMMTPTRVETRLHSRQIIETRISKPWDTSWFSKVELNRTLL